MAKRPPLLLVGTLILVSGGFSGCGHRGDPLPPLRKTPAAPADFRLAQRGDRIELRATAPAASVDGIHYDAVVLEFLHGGEKIDLEKAGSREVVNVLPGASGVTTIPLPAPGTLVRAAARAASTGTRGPRTLTMALVAQAPFEPPGNLEANLGEGGIRLTWRGPRPAAVPPPVGPGASGPLAGILDKAAGARPPVPAAGGAAPAPPSGGESAPGGRPVAVTPAAPTPAAAQPAPAPAQTAPAQTAPAPAQTAPAQTAPAAAAGTQAVPAAAEAKDATPAKRRNGFYVYRRRAEESYDEPLFEEPTDRHSFADEQAPVGATWCYVVRAVGSPAPLIESAPSNEVCLERRDITPPAAPAGLAVLPREGGLELLWSPSAEEDLAGYRVYRASGTDQPPQRLVELPPTKAAYVDTTAVAATIYHYTVTAFDRAGNESQPSEAAEGLRP